METKKEKRKKETYEITFYFYVIGLSLFLGAGLIKCIINLFAK